MSRMSAKNLRLDEILVARELCENRSRAKAVILAGKVRTGTQVLDKPGKTYPTDIELTLIQPPRYVSRGGEKLEAYLLAFPTEVESVTFLDVGASTGGFTDCLLQRGAAEATCIDVGRGQLHYKLQKDSRVQNFEKINARRLTPDQLPHPAYDLIVMDLSFISLKKVLAAIWTVLNPGGKFIALVKPQFEAEKKLVDKGRGIIRDDEVRMRILESIKEWVLKELPGAEIEGSIESPIAGGDGNREFLLGVKRNSNDSTTE